MRARALRLRAPSAFGRPSSDRRARLSPAGLAFLRGRDADGRLRELVAERLSARLFLGALANAFLRRRAHEELGFRSLGDWSRERSGLGARAVREWGRVWGALRELPRLRAAVLSSEVSWTVAREVVGVATPENEAACVDTVRGRTVRAVESILAAVRQAEGRDGDVGREEERVHVRIDCPPNVRAKWSAAVELARRMSGEEIPVWEAAETIAAEVVSGLGAPDVGDPPGGSTEGAAGPSEDRECGLRALRWPRLPWSGGAVAHARKLETHARQLEEASPRTLDRRFRSAMAFLQSVDLEIGRILRQVLKRRLHCELGFARFEEYVRERLDLSPRTARRLVRIARAEVAAPEVATAFREGRITLLQAEAILRGAGTLEEAEGVTLRKLLDGEPARVCFSAPPEVAWLFRALVLRVGLEKMLDHAIATWLEAGRQFRDYADFERDRWRCTVPACTGRRNLHSHHVAFRSAGGPDEAWNRTTLCAWHHQQGVHTGRVRIWGRAPDALLYELGVGRFRSGDRKCG